ncbi:MAG: polyribonucleotide nucleotidyltransferase [Tissierellia bacterium]|jgi:polyribonucleotide nucleotidyltransferase|nr:polyribonucleotide nucleotidyltransferase [Tissierellia bacterium]MDD3226067.1 polyribonucleotide nucleotidyltransferase [Tissierellia bacterium]MDD3752191.1 polyribonucleotide nucleotidyltransferase [Tissierellia bacterium]MDD4045709.1 polyribonucleotide nucleotidyltransferase [Tissierellia bacterium]MDD4677642.1 polyribonucleotide nucleotidyltransferase [Tissierellia bacterium]
MEEKIFKYILAGRELKVTVGKIAELANGSCIVQYGDTVIMANVASSKEPREGIDFFPLSVDFEEKLYSVGKIPGGFIKREGRPGEKAILTSRLIDRPLRPLFPKGYRNDVSVTVTVLSVDQDCSPEIAGMIGSSIALSISDIPFDGPTGAVNLGLIDGKFIVNPNSNEREITALDLTVSGTREAIMMVEAGANEVKEEVMLDAILFAHEEIKKLCDFINEIVKEVGKEKLDYPKFVCDEIIEKEIREYAAPIINEAIIEEDKLKRQENIDNFKASTKEVFLEKYPENKADIDDALYSIVKEKVRENILERGIRPDNRGIDEIRKISCEVGILPRTHGSGLFTRGQTQVLTVTTLGVSSDEQTLDGISEETKKRYMHHYNFPSYSVGETRPSRGPGRREIGHGALAERALEPVLPSEEDFPYTIRLVSEVLSSNGSTSQASVCGSTLSLMDAGVPIKAPVAGVAMGLMKEGDNIVVLTDIQGMEDFLGDMDFKVAGTKDGITAIQMDIKVHGIDKEVLTNALKKAYTGRMFILGRMLECIDKPREEVSKYAPKIIIMNIDPDKIRDVIGSGGKVINKIIEETGVKIDIEDDGSVSIAAENVESAYKAKRIIESIVKEIEVDEIILGKVVRIESYGAFVQLSDNKDGLLHISQIDNKRVAKVEDVLKIGDEVLVKVIGIDEKGKIKLSRKAAMQQTENQ